MSRHRIGSALTASVLALGVPGLAAAPASAKEISFANFVPASHTVQREVLEPFFKTLAKESNGELTVKMYLGGELGKGPLAQYTRAVQGIADMTWSLHGYTSSQFPRTMLAQLPGLNVEAGKSVTWAAQVKYLAREYPGTHVIANWGADTNILMMRNKVVRKVSDLKGLKIRIAGTVPAQLIRALGAVPVQMPAPRMYNALATGLVDGIMTGTCAIPDFKLNEVATSYTVGLPLGNVSFYLVMNQKTWDGLSARDKGLINKYGREKLSLHAQKVWFDCESRTIAMLRKNKKNTVVDVTGADRAAFLKIISDVRNKVIADLDKKGVNASEIVKVMMAK